MSRSSKWTLSLFAAALTLVGWSLTTAVAQAPAAKGKIKVTVKQADGSLGASIPVALFKGDYTPPRGGRGGRGGAPGGGGGAPGGAAGGGAPPASQPALATGATDAMGVYTFDADAGQMTIIAGTLGGGGGGRGRGQGGGGGAPGAGAAPPPGGGAPGAGGAGGRGGARGFGREVVTVEAGKTVETTITLQAGRGGRGGQGGGGGGRAPAAPGQGA